MQLVTLTNHRSITPNNAIQNIQIRHLTPSTPATPVQLLTSYQDNQFQNNNIQTNKNNNCSQLDQPNIVSNNYQLKLNKKSNEIQIFNEHLMLDDRLDIPRLMNMSFNSNSANINPHENNNSNNNFENDFKSRQSSRFDSDWMTSKQESTINEYPHTTSSLLSNNFTVQKEFYNSDTNKNLDFKQRNNFINKKSFNKNKNNNSWNKPWQRYNDKTSYHVNNNNNNKYRNVNNNFNNSNNKDSFTSNYNKNENMCTSDIGDDADDSNNYDNENND